MKVVRVFIFLAQRYSAPIPDREAHVDDRLRVVIMGGDPKIQRGQGLGAATCSTSFILIKPSHCWELLKVAQPSTS
jgi:hypothetical protein